jgi:hypothetical protein
MSNQWYRSEADRLYASDDIEIDEEARISRDEEGRGAFVQAWVWVPAPSNEISEEELPEAVLRALYEGEFFIAKKGKS